MIVMGFVAENGDRIHHDLDRTRYDRGRTGVRRALRVYFGSEHTWSAPDLTVRSADIVDQVLLLGKSGEI